MHCFFSLKKSNFVTAKTSFIQKFKIKYIHSLRQLADL